MWTESVVQPVDSFDEVLVEFDIMMEFDKYLLIHLLNDSRPWTLVSGDGLQDLGPLKVHFNVETYFYIQLALAT
jgi:hypothetical protein